MKKKRARAPLARQPAIGKGEIAAITLARQLGTRVLLDDKVARKVAILNEVAVVGTAGVLIDAKRKRLVRKVKPLIEDLRHGGYRLSDELVARVLAHCREDG
ncbi:MAG: DUF3368 domain-containing protein [Bryobacterales bacterium]